MKRTSLKYRVIQGTCIGLLALTGCESDGSSDRSSGRTSDREPSLEGRSPDDYGRPASTGQPSGSSSDRDRRSVPEDARLVAEGRGTLKYESPRDGMAYIVDTDEDKLVWKGQLNRREVLQLSPDANMVLIDKKVISNDDIKRKNKHKIYFLRD